MDSFRSKLLPVLAILAGIVALWYVFAVVLNAPFQRELDQRAGVDRTTLEFIGVTLSQKKPILPAPHQVAVNFFQNTFMRSLTSSRSLVYHSWVTLSSTLVGFAFGTLLGIAIAVGIVHVTALDRSLMPWIITSQTIPILALAPMIIVVLAAVGITGLIPKALISTYLSFFPVAVGMVKGLRSPEANHLDLMRTYNSSPSQVLWKLRFPASVPFLFASMKVAIAASLVGAIVGELPTGAVAGIGAKLLSGSYYSQTIDIFAALVAGSVVAVLLVTAVGIAERITERSMGWTVEMSLPLRLPWQAWLALALTVAGAAMLPLVADGGGVTGAAVAVLALLAATIVLGALPLPSGLDGLVLFVGAHAAAWLLLSAVDGHEGAARASFYLLLAASWLLAWRLVTVLSSWKLPSGPANALRRILIPALFGAWILIIWEAVVRGAGIPFILLPPPSAVAARMAMSVPVLAADFIQTVAKSVFIGYAIGCATGFACAILADRFLFLRRGLLPIGNMVSALPIVGVAPIMVMWFGFDWPSKAAVVVIMTFFPMLVNTVAGLATTGRIEQDLMRTYAAGYWQTLFKLRLPAAGPFIFNALKINSTLALIGAIVAEFFGTPIVGMGFRISTEVGRMNIDMVWAEIAVAALAGSVFYGLIALVERVFTFWHPSIRGG